MSKLILVDAHGYLHRAYHALPPLSTSKGEPVNAIYGFTRMLFKLLREQQPDYLAVCFDAPGVTFREKIYPAYKATRKETDENLRSQFPLARELVEKFGLARFEKEGFEADDLIATIAKKAENDGFRIVVVSSDKDLLQLVNEKINVFNEPKQTFFDVKKVKEKWGLQPEQLVDLFALMGDASDNVPSVPGIGEKTALKLVQEHTSVEKLLEKPVNVSEKLKTKLFEYREQIQQAKKLVSLESSVPLQINWEACKLKPIDKTALVPFLKRLEFHSLVTELFSKGILSTSKEEIEKFSGNYETILSETQLKHLVQRLQSSKQFAIDVETTGLNIQKSELVGISVSWKKEFAAYIPLRHRYLGASKQLEIEKVLETLRPVLEDNAIKKIGQNLKFDYSILIQAGVKIKNIHFDTMIASYCLDPSKNSHRLKDLVPEFLGRPMMRIEELAPPASKRSASKEMAMDQVEIEKVAPYACSDADCTLQLSEKLAPLLKEKDCESLFYEIEMPLVEILTEMEMSGIKVNTAYLKKLSDEFADKILELESSAFGLAGQEFNLNSSKQLAFILFEKLRLPTARKTKTGYSTDEEVLTFLSNVHELPLILLKHRELSKLKSTYIDGLIPLVQSGTSRVHTSFNQTATATGRLSSSDPNLQNIPIRTEYGRMIRRAFIPEDGNIFLSADYSQIDLRVLAHLSEDPVLTSAFREGADIHTATAAEVFHLPLEKVTEEQRKKAKAINFGIVYGQQAYGLSQSLGISMAEAQEMIEKYFKKYSGVKEWIERTIQQARTKGYVKTLSGRIRYLPEINSKNGAMRAFAERTAINTPVQGTSADIIKIAMIKIFSKLNGERIRPTGQYTSASESAQQGNARMLVQVHDDLLFEVPEDASNAIARIAEQEMENAMKLSIPLRIDLKSGRNWADMKPMEMSDNRSAARR